MLGIYFKGVITNFHPETFVSKCRSAKNTVKSVISIQLIVKVLSFWMHIMQQKNNSYIKIYYDHLLQNESDIWISFIKQIFKELGMIHIWKNQNTFNKDKTEHVLKMKLENMYALFWKKMKKESTKLEFYDSITSEYEMEKYLKIELNRNYRVALSKLRISAHELEIERGRYLGKKREERTCKFCNTIEDEVHFLDYCTQYKELRKELINNIDPIHKNLKIKDLITREENLIGKFINDAFIKRNL